MTGGAKRPLLIAGAAVAAVLAATGIAVAMALGAPATPPESTADPRPADTAPETQALAPPVITKFEFTAAPGTSLHIGAARLAPVAADSPFTASVNDDRPAGLETVSDRSGFVFHAEEPGAFEFSATVFGGDGKRIALAKVTLVVSRQEPEALGTIDDRFRIPALGIDAELKKLSVNTDGRVNPPSAADVYAIRGYGDPRVPGSGTTYLAVHSGRGGVVGNRLVDASGKSSAVEVGTRIIVAGAIYAVTGSAIVDKDELTSDEHIWSGAVDLVVLTCLPNGAKSVNNVVIFAQRA